ncbi:MAG: TRAP transporter small permease subunit [Alphaproteobacteria bacterium]|nr:TRAP transporter small permease subunit [Alphaproteobacteria bacterium]
MDGLIRALERLPLLVGIVGGWLVAPLILGTCYEVVSRYVFDRPTIWAFEAGALLTGANFLLGMAYTLREGAHIRVEAFYDLLPARVRAGIDFFGYLLLAFPFVCWLTWGLNGHWLRALHSNEHSGMSAYNMVMWPIRLVFFVSFLMLALQMLAEMIKRARVLFGAKA